MKPRRRSIPKRHVRLTHNQLAYLHRLVLGPMYESALTSESERRALTQAIAAHNGGYAANSPLPAAAKLVIDPNARAGGFCWRLDIDPLTAEALKATQAQRTHDATHGTEPLE